MFKKYGSQLYISIIASISLSVLIILICFFLKSPNDTILSFLSSAFTIIGSCATLAGLILAFILFDRYGLKNKFVAKQTDKVLELVDALKGRTIMAHSNPMIWQLRPSKSFLIELIDYTTYKEDSKKKIVISTEDYNSAINEFLVLKGSYWMPSPIKSKMEFLDIPGVFRFEDNLKDYIRLEFKHNFNTDLGIPLFQPTLENFTNDLLKLVIELESWLEIHSGIKLDFKLE